MPQEAIAAMLDISQSTVSNVFKRITKIEPTDKSKSVSSIFINNEKCCRIAATEGLILKKSGYIKAFRSSEITPTRQILLYEAVFPMLSQA